MNKNKVALEVKLSDIPKAGLGVFTKQNIYKNQVITFYDGVIIEWEKAKQLDVQGKSSHIRSLSFGFSAIDGFKNPQKANGLGSFINDGLSNKINNAKFKKVFLKDSASEMILIVATRFIQKNEEILVSYGKSYWKKRNEE